MDACDLVRRSILASLGVLGGCSAEPHAGEVAIPLPPSASTSAAPPTPSSEIRPPIPSIGYVTEEDGTSHRAGAERCDATIDTPSCKGDENSKSCRVDADCKDGAHGKCISGHGMRGSYCGCAYSCETDSDCEVQGDKSLACICKGAIPNAKSSQCASASCRADAECQSGVCGVSSYFNGCHTEVTLACHAKTDECWSKKDCADGKTCAAREGTWSCRGMTCVIGRPLLDEGRAVRAGVELRSDWCAAVTVDHPATNAALEHWLEVAALEHASVASFARFTMQLLAFGAPPDLVRGAQLAALDEIEHARLAFGIASRLAGRTLGPGPLDVPPMGAIDLASVVEALVFEGCVGETLGAVEALAQRDEAEGEVATILAKIAEDERAHAELAWRSLAWFVSRFGDPAVRAARRSIERARAELAVDLEPRAANPALGILGARATADLRRRALATCVIPALEVALACSPERAAESVVMLHGA